MAPVATNAAAANPATAANAPPPSISLAPSPASMVVTQWPPAGQKIPAGAVLNFEVR